MHDPGLRGATVAWASVWMRSAGCLVCELRVAAPVGHCDSDLERLAPSPAVAKTSVPPGDVRAAQDRVRRRWRTTARRQSRRLAATGTCPVPRHADRERQRDPDHDVSDSPRSSVRARAGGKAALSRTRTARVRRASPCSPPTRAPSLSRRLPQYKPSHEPPGRLAPCSPRTCSADCAPVQPSLRRSPEVPVRDVLEPRGSRRSPSAPLFTRVSAGQAEGEGFEPSSDLTARNGFRDRLVGA